MKRILFEKPEPLLIVVPLLLFLVIKLTGGVIDNTEIQSFAHRNAGLDQSVLFWYLFSSVVAPVLMHFLLRTSRRWNPLVCRPHVYLTIGLTVLLFFTAYQPGGTPQLSFSPGIIAGFAHDFRNATSFEWMVLTGILWQIAFLCYFLVRIFQRN
jgi:hypothetical protein